MSHVLADPSAGVNRGIHEGEHKHDDECTLLYALSMVHGIDGSGKNIRQHKCG
jgi:hypothetical protein